MVTMVRQMVAKIKFWFGQEHPVFDTTRYEIEELNDFVYIYIKEAE